MNFTLLIFFKADNMFVSKFIQDFELDTRGNWISYINFDVIRQVQSDRIEAQS